jgi:hypothetical protein
VVGDVVGAQLFEVRGEGLGIELGAVQAAPGGFQVGLLI